MFQRIRYFLMPLMLGMLFLPPGASGVSGPFAYVTNHSDASISVIDTSSGIVVSTISLTPSCPASCLPAGLALTPNGNFIYVANEGNGTVSVVSTATNTVSATIALPCVIAGCTPGPVGVAITQDGSSVYVTDTLQGAVFVIATATNTVSATITSGIGTNPFGIAITRFESGNKAYVSNGTPGTTNDVSVISIATNTVTTRIPVGSNPTGIAVSPNSASVFVTNAGSNTVSVISTATDMVIGSAIAVGSGPSSVAFTPNGAFAYVVNQSGGSVSVINTDSNSVTTTVTGVGTVPVQIAITPDGTTAYVAVAGNNDGAVIYTATNTLATTIPVGAGPFGAAIGPQPASHSQTITGLVQILKFPFDNNAYSIEFDIPAGFAPAGSTVTVSAPRTPQTVWTTESAPNYIGTQIAPVSVLNNDGVVYDSSCVQPDGVTPCASNMLDYTTTLRWLTSQTNYCTSFPGLLKQEVVGTPWENTTDPGSCIDTTDPTGGISGHSCCGLSKWAAVFNITQSATPPTATITTPANGATYLLNQIVDSNYSCSGTFVNCAGTVTNGAPIDTASAGTKTFSVVATVNSGQTGSASATYSVAYNICPLYDQTKAVHSGATIPVKMFLCSSTGADVSSPNIVVHATGLFQASTSTSDPVIDAGNANPDNDFRFDPGQGPSGGYIFNLKTTGLGSGNWVLLFTVGDDPTTHSLAFGIK